jgi:hypothetical protein
VEAALAGLRAGAPFVIHACKPAQRLEKFIAKGRFQPRKVFTLRRPFPDPLQVPPAFRTKRAPLGGAVTYLDAVADKIARLSGQREVRAGAQRRCMTERAVFLADHVGKRIQCSVFSIRSCTIERGAVSSIDKSIFRLRG